MELSSQKRTLRQILTSSYFYIPRFQRPYSWTKENVEELWEDAIQESQGEYFIGSMVVYPHSSDTLAVIDGQQRLATIMMLLCALRDQAEELGAKKLADGIHTFVERPDADNEPRFVLKTETAYPFLQDEILTRGAAELTASVGAEERDIQRAFGQVLSNVRDAVNSALHDSTIPESQRKARAEARIKEIRDKILNLLLIFIEVGDRDEATTIFVTLNSRGKDLEPSDLVKAHLLQMMPKKGNLDRPLVRWQAIVDKFDQSQSQIKMTPFLQAVWRSRYDSVTEKNLIRAVRKQIKKAQAAGFLKDLESDAELFRQINEPDYRKWTKAQRDAKESLYFFGNFQISQPMPMLLSLMREFQAGNIGISQLKRSLKAIEDYHFSYNVLASKTSYGGMSLFYAARARLLLAADTKDSRSAQVNSLVSELGTKRPTNAEFDEAFSELWLSNDKTSDRRIIRYVLRRIYQHHRPQAAVDFTKMTVEHLTPQSKGGESYGHLGNLIFVDQSLNEKLANKSFRAKRDLLGKSSSQWIPPDVVASKSWGKSKIDQRTADMAREAREAIWNG